MPAFGLLVALVVLGGRISTTHQALETAASDAARSASLERTPGRAAQAARDAAEMSLSNQSIDCASFEVDVDTAEFQAPVGTKASVTVTLTCTLDLSDLSLPGLPGSRRLTATITSPLDTWRQRS